MTKTRISLYLSILFLALPLLFLGVSCDSLVGPQGPAGETGATGETGAAGEDGTNGVDGEDGGNIPGGILTLRLESGGLVTTATLIQICFDPDTDVLDGDEFWVTIPVAPYYASGGAVFYSLTWRAPDVEPGSYFIYTWIDFDGGSDYDEAEEQNWLQIYDPNSSTPGDAFNGGILDITSTPGEITSPDSDILLPNYTFWEDFAAQIDMIIMYAS